MKMSMGKINVYYDNEYNIRKLTMKKDGHEEYLERDDENYIKFIAKVNILGGIKSYIKNQEKKD